MFELTKIFPSENNQLSFNDIYLIIYNKKIEVFINLIVLINRFFKLEKNIKKISNVYNKLFLSSN